MNNRSGGSSSRIRLILASTSPRRKQFLRELGIRFQLCEPNVDERWVVGVDSRRMASELALRKARACRREGALVLAMDTIVVQGRRILGKPEGDEQAKEMLRLLSGRRHTVVTGLALIEGSREIRDSEVTTVFFRRISEPEIDWYVSTGEPIDKAGAYAIQGNARIFVDRVEGCFYNVVGFPIACFQKALKKLGYTIIDLL